MQPVRDASLTSLLKKRSCFWFKETIFSQTSEAWQVDNAMGLSSCSWYFPLCSHPAPSPASTLPWSLLCAQVLAQLPLTLGPPGPQHCAEGSHCPAEIFLPIFSQPSSFYFLKLPLNVFEAGFVHQLQFPSLYHHSAGFTSSPPSFRLKPFSSVLVHVWFHKGGKDHVPPQLCLSGMVWRVGLAGPPGSAASWGWDLQALGRCHRLFWQLNACW